MTEAGKDVYIHFFWWSGHRKRTSEEMSDGETRLLEGLEAVMTLSTVTSLRPSLGGLDFQGRVLMIDVLCPRTRCTCNS